MKKLLLFFLLTATVNLYGQGTVFEIKDGIDNVQLKNTMEKNVNALISAFKIGAIDNKKPKLSKSFITDEAISEVESMWKTSVMNFPILEIKSRCYNTSTGYQVRGLPVDVIEASDGEKRQELTISFQKDGKISNVAISIELHRYDMIMAKKKDDVDFARRQIIVDFIEKFRTAYNRRDINMLNQVYSDKALIITGKVIKEKPNSDVTKMILNNNRVVYIQQTKKEYMEKLRRIFKTVKYINVRFEDIEVARHPKFDDIYGVTLKQYWHTSSYHDEGYLFLMIDFKDQDNPLIHVRTWQPYKDDNGIVLTKQDEVFHLGSFRIVR
ncbi:MAG: hypothetical protein J6Y23_08360 [Prevotella sp.]|nr:hypothetical protein [Prevotella sp.]